MNLELTVNTHSREEMLDVTSLVANTVADAGFDSGIVICFVPHTTAAITINENADPDVRHDLLYKLHKEIPKIDGYRHAEGNSDAHLKSSLMGFSETVLFDKRRLTLGQWQAIYFCEFDGPRRRRLILRIARLA